MVKIEAIIQPFRLEAVKKILQQLGVEGMTFLEARGQGQQTEIYRGRQCEVDQAKVKIELVLPDSLVEATVQAIVETAKSGDVGDGRVFLYRVDDAIRIRNEQRGVAAL